MQKEDTMYDLYYGTGNLDLDFKYKIDPDFNGNRIFEFGNGFYLTPSKPLAESYIKRNSLINEIKKDRDELSINELINGLTIGGHLHIYGLNYSEFAKNTNVKELEGIDEYKLVLKETVIGYNKNINYRPNRDATFGAICGQFWDDYWAEENPRRGTLEDEKLIEQCVKEVEKKMKSGIQERQICIHRSMVGIDKKNIFEEYLIKKGCEEIFI